ncbi:GTP-binding protein [Clostridium perfringens]|nr:GTP-binding protein [Clostridium perfringens]
MGKKLSELKNEDMLIIKNTGIGDIVLSKEEFVDNLDYYGEISRLFTKTYTTIKYQATIAAREMLEKAIENEAKNIEENWGWDIKKCITEEDINDIQKVLDRILSRNSTNICYKENELVEFDL